MKDEPCAREVLRGAHALMTGYGDLVSQSGSDSCAQSAAILIAAVLRDVHVQSLALTERRHAYELMQWASANPELPGEVMCAGFARGFAQCMDGERDPRNLMLCFAIIPSILASFVTTQEEADALFTAAACYFPITFTPPPNDPVGISTAMLRDALLACLTADVRFCSRAVDLALGPPQSPAPHTPLGESRAPVSRAPCPPRRCVALEGRKSPMHRPSRAPLLGEPLP
jgi:DNA repair/transcription protein MET18/MMS19